MAAIEQLLLVDIETHFTFMQQQLRAETLPDGLRIGNLDSQQLLAITQFLAAQPTPPSLLRFGRPSLEQLYLSLNGGRL